ncbi:MAG: response regulator transcription factor [Deltaproteobacteria bacterium]|nr:response regulator transcription factor [Deltaproteobacteria bacterium]
MRAQAVPPLRVLLVGRDPLARAGLVARLGEEAVSIVGEAAGPASLPGAVARCAPDVVLWDVGAGGDGAELTSVGESPPVVALVEDDIVGRGVGQGGARGVVYRDADTVAVLAALRAVTSGLAVLEPDVLAALVPRRTAPDGEAAEELTAREREVLELLVEGMSNRAIGARLAISEHTAKFHVVSVLGKLGVARRSEAVARALKLGLVTL